MARRPHTPSPPTMPLTDEIDVPVKPDLATAPSAQPTEVGTVPALQQQMLQSVMPIVTIDEGTFARNPKVNRTTGQREE